MLDCALSGPLHLYRPQHFGKELEWLKDCYWSDQDPPELHLAPCKENATTTTIFDVTFRLTDVLELNSITLQSYLTERWQCLIMPGAADGLDALLNIAFGTKAENTRSDYGLLLECLQDKEEIMEDGVENPFIERPQYPLPATAYILLYAETDINGNDCICAQLYQSRFDNNSIETLLSRLFYYPPPTTMIQSNDGTTDYLGALGFFGEEQEQHDDKLTITDTREPHQWKWDILAARDYDMMEKERLRQLQRPDFFAKPRPKPVPKKRNTIDLKFLLERQEANGSGGSTNKPSSTRTASSSSLSPSTTTAKGKRKEQPSSPEQLRKKKASLSGGGGGGSNDTWESENKETIKKRLWSTMSKKRGHDRRSEKSKLLFHQIYQSCQYVFRRTMKDEQVNSKLLDQIIDKHLEFYEELDRSL